MAGGGGEREEKRRTPPHKSGESASVETRRDAARKGLQTGIEPRVPKVVSLSRLLSCALLRSTRHGERRRRRRRRDAHAHVKRARHALRSKHRVAVAIRALPGDRPCWFGCVRPSYYIPGPERVRESKVAGT